jgi:Mg2+ and Co2+ transporter CorA
LKVKISYTVELDEVPNQVYRFLIGENVNTISKDYDNLLKLILESHTEQAINEIDTFRRNLASIDQKLNDAQSILDGYMRARYGSSMNEENQDVQKE